MTRRTSRRDDAHRELVAAIRGAASRGVLTPVTVRTLVLQGTSAGLSEVVVRELIDSHRTLVESGTAAMAPRTASDEVLPELRRLARRAAEAGVLTAAFRQVLVQKGIAAGLAGETVLDAIRLVANSVDDGETIEALEVPDTLIAGEEAPPAASEPDDVLYTEPPVRPGRARSQRRHPPVTVARPHPEPAPQKARSNKPAPPPPRRTQGGRRLPPTRWQPPEKRARTARMKVLGSLALHSIYTTAATAVGAAAGLVLIVVKLWV